MQNNLSQFAHAVGWGALAGAAPFMLFTVPIGIASMVEAHFLSGLYLAVLPLVISGVVTVSAAIIFGLPLTAILHRFQRESQSAYAMAGFGIGIAIPVALLIMTGSEATVWFILMIIFGGVAGTTTGYLWGEWREQLSAAAWNDDDYAPIE